MENPLYLQIMYQQKRIMAENSLCSRKQLSHLMEQFHKTFIICEILKSNIVEEVLRFEVMQLQIEVLFSNYKISFSAKIIKDLRSKGSFAVFIAASNFHNTYIQMWLNMDETNDDEFRKARTRRKSQLASCNLSEPSSLSAIERS